jgi:hypothetical protein
MSDPFESSRRKIAWAKKHLADLKRKIKFFITKNKDLYESFVEPHPDKPEHLVTKIRFTVQIPDVFCEMTGDIVNNLREALDHAMYGVAVAAGHRDPKHAYFPFSGDATTFEANLNGRCKDVPKEIYPLLRSFEPYKGGSEALWALNEVCIANKHKLLVPVGAATIIAVLNVSGTGPVEMPYRPVWDGAKQEMELLIIGPGAQFKGNFNFGFYVAFGEIESVSGKSVVEALDLFVDMVETILGEIEAESRRLGII